MVITGTKCTLRPFVETDISAIPPLLSNHKVWRNMTDRIPHPYTEQDAAQWVRMTPEEGKWHFAIEVNGTLAGGLGGERLGDVLCRSIEMGYWLGESYWGRGIASEAAGLLCDFLAKQPEVDRLQANVFGWNPASARVLEKNGFVLEGRRPRAVFKDGETTDLLLYGRVL